MLALLLGCGVRRGEVLALELQSVQQREAHWVIADLLGKAGHVRTSRYPTASGPALTPGPRRPVTHSVRPEVGENPNADSFDRAWHGGTWIAAAR